MKLFYFGSTAVGCSDSFAHSLNILGNIYNLHSFSWIKLFLSICMEIQTLSHGAGKYFYIPYLLGDILKSVDNSCLNMCLSA